MGANGEYSVDKAPISSADLENLLKTKYDADMKDNKAKENMETRVFIIADPNSTHGMVIDILDKIRTIGIKKGLLFAQDESSGYARRSRRSRRADFERPAGWPARRATRCSGCARCAARSPSAVQALGLTCSLLPALHHFTVQNGTRKPTILRLSPDAQALDRDDGGHLVAGPRQSHWHCGDLATSDPAACWSKRNSLS